MNIYESFAFVSKVLNLQGFYFSMHNNNTQPTKSFRIILSIICYALLTGVNIMIMYRTQMSAVDEVSLLNDLKGSTVIDNLIFSFFFFSRTAILSIVHLTVLVTIFTGNQNISMFFKLLKSFDDTCVAFVQTKRLNENYAKVINAVSIILIVHFIVSDIFIIFIGNSFEQTVLYIAGAFIHLNLKFHIIIMVFLLGAINIRLKHFYMILKSKTSIQSQSEFNFLIKLYKDILEMIQIYNQLFGIPITLQIISILMDILAVVSGTHTQFNQNKSSIAVFEIVYAIFNLTFFIPSIAIIISLLIIADHVYELVKNKHNSSFHTLIYNVIFLQGNETIKLFCELLNDSFNTHRVSLWINQSQRDLAITANGFFTVNLKLLFQVN